jgi:hypothetical protein
MPNSKSNSGGGDDWTKIFSALCYEVFYKFEPGVKLLKMLEDKHFRSPVAYPGREPSWAYFREGENELIRSFTAGIMAHLKISEAQAAIQKKLSEGKPMIGRQRKPQIRPVR